MLEEEGSDSELSEASSDELEDVEMNEAHSGKGRQKADTSGGDESEEEEWEDALGGHHHPHVSNAETAPEVSGDISLTLSAVANASVFGSSGSGVKHGPSKAQRHIRMVTHCMHVQFLMFHNLIRHSWIQDKEVQRILVKKLNKGCWEEVEMWWRHAAIPDGHLNVIEGGYTAPVETVAESSKGIGKAKAGAGKAKSKTSGRKGNESDQPDRKNRDWGATSTPAEPNTPNLSAGDPLIRLLTYLTRFWKQRYKVTAPSLRKRGYLPPWALEAEKKAWKKDPSNANNFGERVENLEGFRKIAKDLKGSRDVGQQLFTALLRGLGIEARMVASLQPVGFGWSQGEEGKPKKNLDTPVQNGTPSKETSKTGNNTSPVELDDATSDSADNTTKNPSKFSRKPDLPHPTYWTEALSPTTHHPIAVSPLPTSIVAPTTTPDLLARFYTRPATADKAKQVFCYVLAFSADGTAKDVTTRYLPRRTWPGRTKGARLPVEKVPIHNRRGKVVKVEHWDWFKSALRPYARHPRFRTIWEEIEDEGDLVPARPAKPKGMDEEGGKETLQGYKVSKIYVLERHLRREEALLPTAQVVRHFVIGKGEKETQEPVYRRKDVVNCKTVESWHKEGREIKPAAQPLKFVPTRAVTIQRKREIAERELEEGEKVKQGLYSKAQTDWITPDPIVDGRIPRNAFGNIDVYVPTMVPKGAVHVPLRGTVRVCKKLGIDYAEACTGFEFGKQRAVPVLTGVVVAAENKDMLVDAWQAEEAEKRSKEEAKREKLVLGLWKKFLAGLRIVERMRREYGEHYDKPGNVPDDGSKIREKKIKADAPPIEDDKETPASQEPQLEGGFLRDDDEDPPADTLGGGFIIEHGDATPQKPLPQSASSITQTPMSLQSAHFPPEHSTEAAQETGSSEDTEDEAAESESSAPKRQPATRGRGRGRAHSRGGRAATASTRKTPAKRKLVSSDDDEEAEEPPSPSRPTPKRQAARKSQNAVRRSHYFEHDSNEETDASVHVGKGQGRGRGAGRSERGKRKSKA
jgi:xeroderma pigmentosum group C-complementing protein